MTPARTIDTRFLDIHNASPAEWAAYHRYRRLRASQDTPDEPLLADADFELAVRKRSPLIESRRYVALIDGEVVGNLFIGARRNGSPDYETFAPFLDAGGGVLHEHRRQGVATALLRPLLDFMEAHGKHTATASADLPAGHAFLSALGATEKLRMIENRLPLAGLDWAELARWKAGVDAPALGLRWEIHAGRVPMDRLAELMGPFTVIVDDMPQGAGPSLRFELQAHITWYEEMDRIGSEHFVVMLVDGRNEVAAVCNAHWDARFPDRVFQALTGVTRPWRRKGLAKAVKAAMLELVHARHPEVQMIITSNAEMNAPILSINQRLGFAVHRCNGQYQLDRQALRDFLAFRATPASPSTNAH